MGRACAQQTDEETGDKLTRISVGFPVYNGERWLAGAITSLLEQTHPDLEIIISDNASTDSTAEIVKGFADRDARIRYIRHPRNMGGAFNHDFVLYEATAPYFRWYAYDDFMDPRCLELCAAALDSADESTVLAWAQTVYLDSGDNPMDETAKGLYWDNSTSVTRVNSLLGRPTDESLIRLCDPIYGLMRREVLTGIRPNGKYQSSDTVQLVELAMDGGWTFVPDAIFYRRRHEESSVFGKSEEEVALWMNPDLKDAVFALPWTKLFLGYLVAVWHSRASFVDRLAATRIVIGWVRQERGWYPGDLRWRLIGSEWKSVLRWLGRRARGSGANQSRSSI